MDIFAWREDAHMYGMPSTEVHDEMGIMKALLKRHTLEEWCAILNQQAVFDAIIKRRRSIVQNA
jgi:hypothetical protein